ncbi:MAG: hypothetical protein JRH17_10605 [Deltaproteobacteria bacterium]|nr:hypothetical protein [Deltaproteobacteria bacterium]
MRFQGRSNDRGDHRRGRRIGPKIGPRIGQRREAGSVAVSLLLLALLIGAGGYNYWRNFQREQLDERPRPFRTYETADLESLRDAYTTEVSQAEGRFSAQNRRRVRPASQPLMAESVDEYERVKRSSVKLRDLKADVAEHEARVREINRELSFRSAQLAGVKLHIKRLITL